MRGIPHKCNFSVPSATHGLLVKGCTHPECNLVYPVSKLTQQDIGLAHEWAELNIKPLDWIALEKLSTSVLNKEYWARNNECLEKALKIRRLYIYSSKTRH